MPDLPLAPILAGLVLGGISGALAAWVSFRSFVAMDTKREESWKEWRDTVNARLNVHAAEIKILEKRVTMLEADAERCREEVERNAKGIHHINDTFAEKVAGVLPGLLPKNDGRR